MIDLNARECAEAIVKRLLEMGNNAIPEQVKIQMIFYWEVAISEIFKHITEKLNEHKSETNN